MATKVTILGEHPQETKKLKPIEAIKYYSLTSEKLENSQNEKFYKLSDYESISVIKTDFYNDIDCVIVTDSGQVFLGKFNDGVVE